MVLNLGWSVRERRLMQQYFHKVRLHLAAPVQEVRTYVYLDIEKEERGWSFFNEYK